MWGKGEFLRMNTLEKLNVFGFVVVLQLGFCLNLHDLPLQKVFPLPDQDNRRPQEKVGVKEEMERRMRTKTSRVILAESL